MNLRSTFIFLIFAMLSFTAAAETVSQKEAKEKACLFFNAAYGEVTPPPRYVYNGKDLTTAKLFTPFYVFNTPRKGFVIISAENKAFPVLGYSLTSEFRPDAIVNGERSWLENYAKDIELIRYDSRVPEAAIEAWRDYPAYLADMLSARASRQDIDGFDIAADKDALEGLQRSDKVSEDAFFSASYTPERWADLINAELKREGSVAIGYVDWGKDLHAARITGRKGDYYDLHFGTPNDWHLRLAATEIFSDRFIALLNGAPILTIPEKEDDEPFEYWKDILAGLGIGVSGFSSGAPDATRSSETDEGVDALNEEPLVRSNGGGHFEVLLPENAKLAMIYSLTGSMLGVRTYKSTPLAHINIEEQPAGFYFVTIIGESGKPYGIKLYR